jgi:hypothetical protein
MPSVTAKRKRPNLIFVRPRFDVYKMVSLEIRAIFADYTPIIEPDRALNQAARWRLHRLFVHQPEVMLCVLVIVLDFGCITGRSGGARELHIAFVAPSGIGKPNACESA